MFSYEIKTPESVKAGDTVRSISGQPFVVLSVEVRGGGRFLLVRKPRGRATFGGYVQWDGSCRITTN